MSKNYFELDIDAKKALATKHKDKREATSEVVAETVAPVAPVEEEIVVEEPVQEEEAVVPEEEVAEYPLNQD
jgi:hypothetical protein